LVDDEERILNFLKAKLKLLNYEVILAANGIEGLNRFRDRNRNLAVLDVVMPKMDGFQTLKELRSFSSVPVIMLQCPGR